MEEGEEDDAVESRKFVINNTRLGTAWVRCGVGVGGSVGTGKSAGGGR